MIRKLLLIISITLPLTAHADLETDRTVGNCVGLLFGMKKPSQAKHAIAYADNQDRALNFALAWMDGIKKNDANKNRVESLVFSATKDCRKIGIRASD